MTVMTAQAPLSLAPAGSIPVGDAAALIEDGDGGRVFIHGELCYLWDAADAAGRRLAAVQLVRVEAATQAQVATAFGVTGVTVWRWGRRLDASGVTGIGDQPKGPKGPSKLTPDLVRQIRRRRDSGESLRTIGAATGVVLDTVRRALAEDPDVPEEAPQTSPDESYGDIDTDDAYQPDADAHQPHADEQHTGADEPETADSDVAGEHPAADADATGTEEEDRLPMLADPPPRVIERGLARWGLLGYALPVFTPAARVPLAGLLLALPGLATTGLLPYAHQVYTSLPQGFYGLDTILVETVLRCLAGEPRAEGATRVDPIALGRVLGMDRAPEVKTIRRKFAQLADRGSAEDLLAGMARHHLHQANQTDPDLAAVLYVDGHTRVYHGKRKIAKTHVARLKFPAPATAETWVCDADGGPVLAVLAEPGASLAQELRRLLPDLRKAIGDNRRVLVGFDRGGWSPKLFKHMYQEGFDVLTWRKGPAEDVPDEKFHKLSFTDEAGRVHTWDTAETTVKLPLDKEGKETFTMRQITRRDAPGGKQVHILTTRPRRRLSTRAVNYRMGNRWREENFFRYGRAHYDLDSVDNYSITDDDPGRMVPNPAKKQAHNAVLAARARYDRASAAADTALLQMRSPEPGQTAMITNADHDAATAAARTAAAELDATQDAHKETPSRLPLGEVNPGQQILEVQTKLLTHAIKIAAYNTTRQLVRDLRIHTDYARAADEAHVLIRQVLIHSGDIDPDMENKTLTVRLDPLPTGRATRAVAELCEHLTATKTRYPGTDLVLRYHIKSRR